MANFQNEFTYRRFLEQGREDEFDRLFDSAVSRSRSEILGKRFPMYINGKEAYAGEEMIENSPIDGTLIGRFQKGRREHAKQAVAAALAAFEDWRDTDYRERSRIMIKAADLFRRDKFVLAAVLSIENGKTRYESVGEVDEAIDFLNYYALEIEKNKGYARKNALRATETKAYERFKAAHIGFQGAPGAEESIRLSMKPFGVFGVIAPFNFPISISVGMSSGALVTGNTVVFKPSSTDNMTMLTGLKMYEIFKSAGLPDGVFNYVTGPGSEVGDELITSRDVSGIVFTGSKATGLGMIRKSYDSGLQKVFIVEMGGKNPAVISKYADIDEAVSGVASAAFGYGGQKCSACSRAYVQESIKEEFLSKLLDTLRSFKVGNPLSKEVYIGPLASQKALQRYLSSIKEAEKTGRVLFGGHAVNSELKGYYVEPTVIEIDHSNRLMHEELFVPILAIDTFRRFEEAIRKANDVEFGLTAGLYSKNKKEINEFINKIQAGVVYVNRRSGATTGAVVGVHAFVGWKGSGLTGKGTGSKFYLQQFLREQSSSISRRTTR